MEASQRSETSSPKRIQLQNLQGIDSQFTDLLDGGKSAAEQNLWYFEIAWEVANQVGGINTMLRTKAAISTEEMGDQYCMIGPYVQTVKIEVELIKPNEGDAIFKVIEKMTSSGFKVVFGRWLIEGYPKVLLFDIGSAFHKLDEWKEEIWNTSRIGIPWVDQECNNAMVFGFLTAMFLAEFQHLLKGKGYICAHFHEWIAGIGLMVCRTRHVKVATIFTTHATMLGRHLCAGNVDFYNNIDKFVLDKEAGDRSIYQRYCIERAVVHCAHIFTTVSDITAFEAEHLLGRKADLVLPNGLDVKSTFLHEFQTKHSSAKEKIHNFIRGHFYGHLDFDLDKTLYIFSSGRYEFTNKGADIFIEALARLNYYIKSSGLNVTIVAFLIFPTSTNNFNVESLRGQAVSKQLRETVGEIQKDIGERLFDMCIRGDLPVGDDLLPKKDVVKLKRCIYAAQVIFHPEFLSSTSPLLGMEYEEFVRGCNLGVFPSYYEPWGYTPAECTVMGVPSVCTNLCGFGCFIQQHVYDPLSYGIYIVDRRNRGLEESITQLAQFMFDFASQTRRQRIVQRNRTERLSELLDWKNLGIYYRKARYLALHRTYPEIFPEDTTHVMTFVKSLPTSRHATPRQSDGETGESPDSEEERELLRKRVTPV